MSIIYRLVNISSKKEDKLQKRCKFVIFLIIIIFIFFKMIIYCIKQTHNFIFESYCKCSTDYGFSVF